MLEMLFRDLDKFEHIRRQVCEHTTLHETLSVYAESHHHYREVTKLTHTTQILTNQWNGALETLQSLAKQQAEHAEELKEFQELLGARRTNILDSIPVDIIRQYFPQCIKEIPVTLQANKETQTGQPQTQPSNEQTTPPRERYDPSNPPFCQKACGHKPNCCPQNPQVGGGHSNVTILRACVSPSSYQNVAYNDAIHANERQRRRYNPASQQQHGQSN